MLQKMVISRIDQDKAGASLDNPRAGRLKTYVIQVIEHLKRRGGFIVHLPIRNLRHSGHGYQADDQSS
jgi:hypothetical protein